MSQLPEIGVLDFAEGSHSSGLFCYVPDCFYLFAFAGDLQEGVTFGVCFEVGVDFGCHFGLVFRDEVGK